MFERADYRVERIDGDYAYLKRTDVSDDSGKCVARALLPGDINEGSRLTYEMLKHTLLRYAKEVQAIWIRGSMDKKTERLVNVTRMRYEQDRAQSEIADRYGISRPMISKLLKEARDRDIVIIRINTPEGESDGAPSLMELVGRCFGIYDGVAVPGGLNDQTTNEAVAEAAIPYLSELGSASLGIGWSHIIGDVVEHMEQKAKLVPIGTFACPLIGNGGVELKNYHSSELVRSIVEHNGTQPKFIYSPACMLPEQELKLTRKLDSYHETYYVWEKPDVALVNIGNFPSVPDFASEARYGDLLIRQKAVGRVLNYFMDSQGHIIQSDTDYAIQIPLGLLTRTRHMVGICSANTSPKAFRAALKTGYLEHFIAPEHVVREAPE